MTESFSQWNEQEVAELRKVFYAQAHEITDDLQDAVLRLEADPHDAEALKIVKRHVHTLKGDSRAMGLGAIGGLCHRMEDVITLLMDGNEQGGHEAVELLLACIDAVNELLTLSENGKETEQPLDVLQKIDQYLGNFNPVNSFGSNGPQHTEYEALQALNAHNNASRLYEAEIGFHPLCAEKSIAALMVSKRLAELGQIIRSVPEPSHVSPETLSMTLAVTTDADSETIAREAAIEGMTITLAVREVRNIEPACYTVDADERASADTARTTVQAAPLGVRTEMLRVEASRVDLLLDLVGELIIGRSMVEQLTKDIESGAAASETAPRLLAVNASLERTVSDLQRGIMKMRMVPVHHVFRKFPKIVRDLSIEKGKRVRLELIGSETELDKRVVDALGEPLSHIVRNLIDHGIEPSEERRAAGKEPEGLITIKAYHEASQIVIEAGDDGRGIAVAKLKRKAVERGYLTGEEAEKLQHSEAVNLVFLSGLSTADTLSETSGRGVGMDAVKAAVDAMRGSVEIDTAPGKGTLFRVRLPLTLAVIRALLFEVSGQLYAVPVPVIAEVAKIPVDDLITVDGRKTLMLRGRPLSIISLHELFGLDENGSKKKFVLVLGMGTRKAGLLVDRIMWQQELVIKAMDNDHVQSPLVAGASILGDGKVVLILDVIAAFKKAVEDERKKLIAVTI